MKIIISENKLLDLQINYLNKLIGYNVSSFDNFIIIYYPLEYDDEGYDLSEVLMEYDYEDGRLYVDNDFIRNFATLYFPDESQTESVIKNWFETYFGVDINYIQS